MKQTLLFICLILFALPSWGQTTFSGGSISGGKIGSKIISLEAKEIAENFEFYSVGQVAVDTEKQRGQSCKNKINYQPPNVLNSVKASYGHGLDERFSKVGEFFRKASATCLGWAEIGYIDSCMEIHTHALEYARNSKIKKPRGSGNDPVLWNDTLTVSMRLTGPMATALGVAWNKFEAPISEKKQIIKWLEKIHSSFEHGMRNDGFYDPLFDGFYARYAGHNHAVQSSIAGMSIGALTGNKDLFITGIDQWFITLDTMREDGSLPIETRRGTKAMLYLGRTISGLFAIAQRAKVQGVDLFSIEREKNIHRVVDFYLNVADEPKLILKYAKKNISPGHNKDYTFQEIKKVSSYTSSGHGWVKLYISQYPNHPNTKRLLNISEKKSHITASLKESVSQKGKQAEWITVDTGCFYNTQVEKFEKGKQPTQDDLANPKFIKVRKLIRTDSLFRECIVKEGLEKDKVRIAWEKPMADFVQLTIEDISKTKCFDEKK